VDLNAPLRTVVVRPSSQTVVSRLYCCEGLTIGGRLYANGGWYAVKCLVRPDSPAARAQPPAQVQRPVLETGRTHTTPAETEATPRKKQLLADFRKSDALVDLKLPDDRLRVLACAIEDALTSGQSKAVHSACANFLATAAEFYRARAPGIRVLEARQIRVWEGGFHTELFGDYHTGTATSDQESRKLPHLGANVGWQS
jgi:hypothetical protein